MNIRHWFKSSQKQSNEIDDFSPSQLIQVLILKIKKVLLSLTLLSSSTRAIPTPCSSHPISNCERKKPLISAKVV